MPELILHHYDLSPFAEKIRLIFGLKKLAWRSVIIPAVLPKPDYTALTGGYRRTPSLQWGADLYCDTRLIAQILDAHQPSPPLCPAGRQAQLESLVQWAEDTLFWPCARAVVGANAEHLPAEFHADRAAMRGRPPPSLARTRAAGEEAARQLAPLMREVEALLKDASPFLLGHAPSLADLAVYHCLWFLEQLPQRLLARHTADPRLFDWMIRIAALGHGQRAELPAADAIAMARQASPAATPAAGSEGLAPGMLLEVEPEERTSPPVRGTLVHLDATRVVLRRHDARAGEVQVHFPRRGYRLLVPRN